jgi:hypothetical protein
VDSRIENMLEEAPQDMSGTATTPAAAHLFEMNDTADDLLKDDQCEASRR